MAEAKGLFLQVSGITKTVNTW